MEDIWPYVQEGGFYLWLTGALFFVVWLGVFSPKPLRAAPTRESGLSLPVVGAVIVLYFLIQAVTFKAGEGLGWLSAADFAPASQPVATQPASGPASASASAASGGAASQEAATAGAPVEQGAAAVRSARLTVVLSTGDGIARCLTGIIVVVFVRRLFKEGMMGWGLHPRQFAGGVLKGVFGFLVTYPVLMLFALGLMAVYGLFQHELSEHVFFEAMEEGITLGQSLLLCVSAIVIAPLTEELFFRGIVQTTLIQFSWGLFIPQLMRSGTPYSVPADYRPSALHRWGAIVLTSAFFAWQHQLDQAPIIFVLSLALGYVYERTGNLWAPIALHMAFNSTEIAQFLETQLVGG